MPFFLGALKGSVTGRLACLIQLLHWYAGASRLPNADSENSQKPDLAQAFQNGAVAAAAPT